MSAHVLLNLLNKMKKRDKIQGLLSIISLFGNKFTKFIDKGAQGGQSHGQHDWVHGFPEPVRSFITFVVLSQISCDKVQKNPHIFLHKTVSKFLLGLL